MPSAGPVLSYPLDPGDERPERPEPAGHQPQGPAATWKPNEIVTGFLTAAAAFGDQPGGQGVPDAPGEQELESRPGRVRLQEHGPDVAEPGLSVRSRRTQAGGKSAARRPTASKPERRRSRRRSRSTARSPRTCPGAEPTRSPRRRAVRRRNFQLVKTGGQWRISSARRNCCSPSGQFADDYELRNLYFFDPSNHYLVPDPVYVPLQARPRPDERLVNDLIKPPRGLAGGATQTAFPGGTNISDCHANGVTGSVNLDRRDCQRAEPRRPCWRRSRRSCCARWSARARTARR